MRKTQLPIIFNLKVDKTNKKQNSSSKFNNFLMISSGILLTISETLPFLSNIKSNGILDAIKNILNEIKKEQK